MFWCIFIIFSTFHDAPFITHHGCSFFSHYMFFFNIKTSPPPLMSPQIIIHQSSITTVLYLLLPPKKKPVVFSSLSSKSSWSRNKEILKWVLWASFKPGRDVTFVRWGPLAVGVELMDEIEKSWGVPMTS